MPDKQSTIVIKLIGGLGNQLFQYALGRAAAIRSDSALVLDRRFLDRSGIRYGLHHFNVAEAIETGGKLPPDRKTHRLRYYLWRDLKLSPRLIKEKTLSFDPTLLRPMSNVYLEGYWQSELYFADVADTIRSDLRIVTPPDPVNAGMRDEIASQPSVSLHIRLGDYLLPNVQSVHGSCSKQYYLDAVRLVAEKMGEEPVIYAFSDEPEWVRENLDLPCRLRVVSHNDAETNYEDLRLMSACRHHIIANSSFSWWGAWLNPSPDKIVVAPKRWFADPAFQNPDITPVSWHRLEN